MQFAWEISNRKIKRKIFVDLGELNTSPHQTDNVCFETQNFGFPYLRNMLIGLYSTTSSIPAFAQAIKRGSLWDRTYVRLLSFIPSTPLPPIIFIGNNP